MARVKVWQRGSTSNFRYHAADFATATLSFTAGATLLRLHYTFSIQAKQDTAFADLPAPPVAMGVSLLDGAPPPSPPDPILNPTADYLWYEQVMYHHYQHTVLSPTYVSLEGPTGPPDRDVKAERIFAHANPELAWSFNDYNISSANPLWFLMVTYSALVLTAP